MPPEKKGVIQLCLIYLAARPVFAPEAVRQSLYDELDAIVGPLTTTNLTGFPAFDARKLIDVAKRDAIADFLLKVRDMATS